MTRPGKYDGILAAMAFHAVTPARRSFSEIAWA